MNQATLELDRPDADTIDRTGFDIGWDHAHHGLVPPARTAACRHAGVPGLDGRARRLRPPRARHARAAPGSGCSCACWPGGAASRSMAGRSRRLPGADPRHVVPRAAHAAGRAASDRLGGRSSSAWIRGAGYVAGNLAVISLQAAQARDGVDCTRGRAPRAPGRTARRARGRARRVRLVAAGRAALVRDAAALPPGRAAAAGGAAAPGVRLINAVQRLQALVTLQFADAGLERARARDGRAAARTHPAPRLQPLRRRAGTARCWKPAPAPQDHAASARRRLAARTRAAPLAALRPQPGRGRRREAAGMPPRPGGGGNGHGAPRAHSRCQRPVARPWRRPFTDCHAPQLLPTHAPRSTAAALPGR